MKDDLYILKTPKEVSEDIAGKLRARRRKMKITQAELAARSGVSLGSLKRFEQTGEISFVSLLKLAWVLDCLKDFEGLFEKKEYSSIEELIND